MSASQPAYFNLQEFSDLGRLLVGGRLYTYAYGTTAHKTAFADPDGTVPHTYTPDGLGGQYIALNARGELPAPLYLADGSYDIALKRVDGSTVWTRKADGVENSFRAWIKAVAGQAGASLIGFMQAGIGAILRSVQDKLRERPTPADYGAKGDLIADDTAALQRLLDAHLTVYLDGTYKITDELLPRSNQTVYMTARTIVKQTTANKSIFRAKQLDNVWFQCSGGVLYGEGSWSGGWTGNQGHEDRAIQLIGCTRSGVVAPIIKNCANAGIAIIGGRGIKLITPHIEGTHLYSSALPGQANFQNGIYITDDITYGKADEVVIVSPDISGVAQGILRENQGSASLADVALNISNPNIHDIPGQHAFYIQGGLVSVSNPTLSNINLSGFKVQSADANQHINGFTCTGITAKNVLSNLVELATIGAGSLANVKISGAGDGCGTGIAIGGKVSNVEGDLQLTTTAAYAAYLYGSGMQDVELKLKSNVCGQDGVLITATNATGIKIRPTLRNCNNGNTATECGIRVQSPSAQVEIFDPDVTDTNSRMQCGLFNVVDGSVVKVRGSAKFTGAQQYGVRAIGLISEWPTECTVSGLAGDILGIGQIGGAQPIEVRVRTTSSSNTPLWYMASLIDESAILVKVDLVGKLVGSTERRAVTASRLFYRDGGGPATLQGPTSVVSDAASAGFLGTYSLQADGAIGLVLLVNSAGGGDIDWIARVTVLRA